MEKIFVNLNMSLRNYSSKNIKDLETEILTLVIQNSKKCSNKVLREIEIMNKNGVLKYNTLTKERKYTPDYISLKLGDKIYKFQSSVYLNLDELNMM